MDFLRMTRLGVGVVTGALLTAVWFGMDATLSACGESGACSRLREDTYASKKVWDQCDPNQGVTACIKVFGNPKDCTGVLSCDFAVNPLHRAEAEQTVLVMGQQSQGCYLCATPNCAVGDIAYCEPMSRRCIIVTTLTEAGVPETMTSEAGAMPFDSGSPLVPDVAVVGTEASDGP
jgi:hypothetical protein